MEGIWQPVAALTFVAFCSACFFICSNLTGGYIVAKGLVVFFSKISCWISLYPPMYHRLVSGPRMSSTWSPRNMREFCDKVFAGRASKTVKTSSLSVSYQLPWTRIPLSVFLWNLFYTFSKWLSREATHLFCGSWVFSKAVKAGENAETAATYKTWKNQRLGHFHVFLQFSFLLALLLHLPERCGPKTETSYDSHLCAWECLHATPLNDDDCGYKLTMCISLSSKESMNSWWIVLSWLKYDWNPNSPASQLRVSCALPLAWEWKCPPYSFWDYEAHFLFVSRFKIHMKSLHNLYFHLIKIINFHPKKNKKNPKETLEFSRNHSPKTAGDGMPPPLAFLFCLQGFLFPLSFHGLGEAALKFTVWSNLLGWFLGPIYYKTSKNNRYT